MERLRELRQKAQRGEMQVLTGTHPPELNPQLWDKLIELEERLEKLEKSQRTTRQPSQRRTKKTGSSK